MLQRLHVRHERLGLIGCDAFLLKRRHVGWLLGFPAFQNRLDQLVVGLGRIETLFCVSAVTRDAFGLEHRSGVPRSVRASMRRHCGH